MAQFQVEDWEINSCQRAWYFVFLSLKDLVQLYIVLTKTCSLKRQLDHSSCVTLLNNYYYSPLHFYLSNQHKTMVKKLVHLFTFIFFPVKIVPKMPPKVSHASQANREIFPNLWFSILSLYSFKSTPISLSFFLSKIEWCHIVESLYCFVFLFFDFCHHF